MDAITSSVALSAVFSASAFSFASSRALTTESISAIRLSFVVVVVLSVDVWVRL